MKGTSIPSKNDGTKSDEILTNLDFNIFVLAWLSNINDHQGLIL